MDQQILQAVDIALSGTSDPALKQQAYNFIEQIKSTPEGYHSCLDILTKRGHQLNDQFRFFIFQVIDDNVCRLPRDDLFSLSEILFTYLHEEIKVSSSSSSTQQPLNSGKSAKTPSFLRNKIAATFATLFCATYLEVRSHFLKDLLALDISPSGSDYYLRILLAIHLEIGDKFIARLRENLDRNTLIKDQIRQLDMEPLIMLWKAHLLGTNASDDDEIISLALKNVAAYVEWMEISYFVQPDLVNAIFAYLQNSCQRLEACKTLVEIISKKMKPASKLELLALFNITSVLDSTTGLRDIEEDVEWAENVARLLNQVGIELQIVLEQEARQQLDLAALANQQILAIWPLILVFLLHEYDDVTQQVFPFISAYLLVCKRYPVLILSELTAEILTKIILKMRWEEDDEDDEQFPEIRAKLKTFQDTIAALNPEVYLQKVPVVIQESLFESKPLPKWTSLELGLFELSNFADSLRSNLIGTAKDQITLLKPYGVFQEFFVKLVNSDWILSMNHPLIQLLFFELIVRHYPFLKVTDDQLIVFRTLRLFTSPCGIFSLLEKVRVRSWYLFFKFVKLARPRIPLETLQETAKQLQPLLVIKAELPTTDDDEDVVESGNFNGQMYLFETAGLLLANAKDGAPDILDFFLRPLFADLEVCVGQGLDSPLVQLQAHHDLMAIGTISSGYTSGSELKHNVDAISKINNAAQVVLFTLETFSKLEKVRDGARFAFARFIPILGEAITNHLSKLVLLFLSAPELKYSEMTDFLGFVGQIAHQFQKNENIYQLLNGLVLPLVEKSFSMIKYRGANNEFDNMPNVQRDKNALKKAYMNFLTSIVTNHQASLLITETNRSKFPEIIELLFESATYLDDATVSRLGVIEITNFVIAFGANGKINDPEDKLGVALPAVEGVDQYLMTKLLQLLFEFPLQHAQFDIKDAQLRIVAQEMAVLLKTYHKTKGDEFLSVLLEYLTTMGLPQELMNDFGTHLVKLEAREFKKYFVDFINNFKK